MSWNTLDTGLKLFFSRAVQGREDEDLVEKQNAEVGLMPVVVNEAAAYGYEAENRHFTRAFLGKEPSRLTFADGLEVVQLLMTAYRSAEERRTLDWAPDAIADYVPPVASGTWRPPALDRLASPPHRPAGDGHCRQGHAQRRSPGCVIPLNSDTFVQTWPLRAG